MHHRTGVGGTIGSPSLTLRKESRAAIMGCWYCLGVHSRAGMLVCAAADCRWEVLFLAVVCNIMEADDQYHIVEFALVHCACSRRSIRAWRRARNVLYAQSNTAETAADSALRVRSYENHCVPRRAEAGVRFPGLAPWDNAGGKNQPQKLGKQPRSAANVAYRSRVAVRPEKRAP